MAQFEDAKVGVKAFTMDPRLEDVVQRMFLRCYKEGEYQQVRGVHFVFLLKIP